MARAADAVALCCMLTLAAPAAYAQTNLQLWGNVTLDWVRDRLTYELDLEPKVMVDAPEGEPGWHNIDLTPSVEYALRPWLDVSAQATVGYTMQTDDVNTTELTPALGARFHLFSRSRPTLVPTRLRRTELPPARRLVIRDFVRVESRNFFESGAATGSSSSVRFRNRLEFMMPLNTEKLSDDGTRYVLADWEWFIPLGEPDERFANKQRIRSGFGYRRSHTWRFEAIYMWTRSRNTIEDGFKTNDNTINVKVKRFF